MQYNIIDHILVPNQIQLTGDSIILQQVTTWAASRENWPKF